MPEQGVVAGHGSANRVGDIAERLSNGRIMLITGRESFLRSGADAIIRRQLEGRDYFRFSDFDVNPKIEDVERCAAFAAEQNVGLIIGVGGGSVLDMAKLTKASMADPSRARLVAAGEAEVAAPPVPMMAVPTTAGSGSEATHFAVVYVDGAKYSVAAPELRPQYAVLDGSLIASNSDYQIAVNGLDALAQAIESYWANGATPESLELAREAIPPLLDHLPKAIADRNPKSLQHLIQAAHLSGKAINISKTTAPHAWSYGFTSQLGISHGHAVWLTLPAIFQIHAERAADGAHLLNGGSLRERLETLTRLLRLETSDFQSELEELVASLGVEPAMRNLGATSTNDLRALAANVNLERLANNPVPLDGEAIRRIFGL